MVEEIQHTSYALVRIIEVYNQDFCGHEFGYSRL